MNQPTPFIELEHNFRPEKFMWLWAKYVVGVQPQYHCTNVLKGKYSQKLSKAKNLNLAKQHYIMFDEQPAESFKAIYICGVAKQGYSVKKNYPHNLHCALQSAPGRSDYFEFEGWKLQINNAIVLPIPPIEKIPEQYLLLPPSYTTCRIFRWAVNYLPQ